MSCLRDEGQVGGGGGEDGEGEGGEGEGVGTISRRMVAR